MSIDEQKYSENRQAKSKGEQDVSKTNKDNARAAIQYFVDNSPPGALREVMESELNIFLNIFLLSSLFSFQKHKTYRAFMPSPSSGAST